MRSRFGKVISAVRISVGLASNFADVYRMVEFTRGLLDQTVEQVGPVEGNAGGRGNTREST